MRVKTEALGNMETLVTVIRANLQIWNEDMIFDYETYGRSGHLLYYMLDNEIDYWADSKKICTVMKNDIIFLPSGSKYTSVVKGGSGTIRGIGLVFELATPDGEPIEIDSPIRILAHDSGRYFYKRFHKIYLSSINPYGSALSSKANFYSLLDSFFSSHIRDEEYEKNLHDIFNAIHALEYSPEVNYSNEQLASFCYMSNSTFLRKFKAYSGGITPLQYRNNIRLAQAEELINTSLTIDEIAEKLGFYDGAHLCKVYKRLRGHTLKKRGEKKVFKSRI